MQKYVLFLGIAILIGSIYLINENNESVEVNQTVDQTIRFLKFKAKFGKRYGPTEDKYRFAVFIENMIQADLHNAKPESTYTMGETQFADLKKSEFVDIYLRKIHRKNEDKMTDDDYDYPIFSGPKNFPASFDWRKYPGVSSKVKSQGACGSCWAFASVAEVEAYFAVKKGILNLDLSEQQLVDCQSYDFGCDGGQDTAGLEFASRYGITTEEVYPYVKHKIDLIIGLDGNCKVQTGPYQINAIRQVIRNDINALKSALSVQPVTVSVISANWYLYTSGVFNYCDHGYPWEIDHIVIAMGYDAESWIIKNSWGTDWGENGYIRLATGNCNNVLQWIYAAV